MCYREDPCQRERSVEPAQANAAPTARSLHTPTSLHFAVNPLVSRISDRNGGEMLHQLFCFELSKTLASPKLSLVTALRAGKCIVPAFSGGVIRGAEKEKSDRRFDGETLLCRKVYLTLTGEG